MPKLTSPMRFLIIVLAAIAPMAGCVVNGIFWDDPVLLNQRLLPENCSGLGDLWRQPYWGLVSGPPDTYRPLSLTLIYFEKLAFGDRLAAFRIVSLLLHAANSLLVYRLVAKLAGEAAALPAALAFAMHPVHVEAVAMIYGQLELVSFMFVILAVLAYLNMLDSTSKARPMAFALGFGFLAYCSKESALMLPALLRLTWLYRTPMTPGGPRGLQRFFQGVGREALFVLLALPYLALRHQALGGLAPPEANTVSGAYTAPQRLHAVIVALAHGLRLCTVPMGQSLYYGHLRDSIFGRPANEFIWLIIACAIVWMLAADIGRRAVAFGLAWFLLALAPVANIIPSGVLVAERTLYLPSFGLCFIGGVLVDRAIAKKLLEPAKVKTVFILVLMAYSLASARFASRLRTAETHWRSNVKFYPRSPLAHLELGGLILERVKKTNAPAQSAELDEAASHLRKAFELNPSMAQALLGLGYIAKIKGDTAGVEALFRKLQETNPDAKAELEAFRNLMANPWR